MRRSACASTSCPAASASSLVGRTQSKAIVSILAARAYTVAYARTDPLDLSRSCHSAGVMVGMRSTSAVRNDIGSVRTAETAPNEGWASP